MAGIFASSVLNFTSKLLATIQKSSISASSSSSSSCNSSVDEDLEKLKMTLLRIQVVLHDAEEREIRDKSVKLWLKELKDVGNKAVDVLGEYEYELLRSKVEAGEVVVETTNGKRMREEEIKDIAYYDAKISAGKRTREEEVNQLTTSFVAKFSVRDSIAHRIAEIRERFDEIAKDRDALCLRDGDGERRFDSRMTWSPSSSHVDESGVYGRKVEKNKVIKLLLSKDKRGGKKFSVIPIVGMGGIGKTTSAQLVYNDPRICQHFDLRGWVCVSEDFDVIRLTRAIIGSITRCHCAFKELSVLQGTLKEELKGKKVLLVLDDVWNEKQSHWDSLRAPFLGARLIKIIITTRIDSVAKIMQTMPLIHINSLSEDLCWLLFRRRAFGDLYHSAPTNLVEIGKKIVKKCGGLPLAVKSLASLLQYETNEERWMDILESEMWELAESKDEVMPALRLSYQRMPTPLKPCFVYCSLFPKDYMFVREELIKLWMAQGYIQPKRSKRTEDIGSEYFYELLNRSFFQYSRTVGGTKDDNEEMFVMHDMIHDLAQFISEGECFRVEGEKLSDDDIPDEARHLFVSPQQIKQFHSFNKCKNLRTFVHYGPSKYTNDVIHVKMLDDMILNLGRLWTLDLSHIRIEEFPDSIGHLKHLRYLGLRSSKIKRLPESLYHLYNLQTLNFGGSLFEKLPIGIWNLINLRHLEVPYDKSIPPGIGKLTGLQTLKVWYRGLGELRALVNLRELEILELSTKVNVKDAKAASLKDKVYLQCLSLSFETCNLECGQTREMILTREELAEGMLQTLQPYTSLKKLEINCYDGGRFPSWVGGDPSFRHLVYVSLMGCSYCKFLPPLGLLPSLRDLHIGYTHIRSVGREFCYPGEVAVIKVFPSLEKLRFYGMFEWEEWCGILDGQFPRLRILRMSYCHNLTTVVGLQNLTSLQELKIHYCPKLRLSPDVRLRRMPQHMDIWNCPGMEEWCQSHGIQCHQEKARDVITQHMEDIYQKPFYGGMLSVIIEL